MRLAFKIMKLSFARKRARARAKSLASAFGTHFPGNRKRSSLVATSNTFLQHPLSTTGGENNEAVCKILHHG